MAERLTAMYRRLVQNEDAMEDEANEEIKLNENDVSHDLSTQAEKYMKWARLTTLAEADYKALERKSKQVKQDSRNRARNELIAAKEKSTEGRLDEMAELDPANTRAQEAVLEAYRVWQLFHDVEMAFYQRYEMAKSLNVRQCRELGFYPHDSESMVKGDREKDIEFLQRQVLDLQGK